jgi:catechol 2,3-dioxygenase-like lactoylglutathione lyase family enzyme
MEPRLDAIGIVTADMAASCRFYALLGVPVGEPPEGDDHFEATLPSGVRLMWDSVELVKQINADWQPPVGHRLGLAFHCGTAAGVDTTHAAVIAAGFGSKNDPWDAFWGQRYAQVIDPDDNLVDLFAPLDSPAPG